jgi:hypothetical protein
MPPVVDEPRDVRVPDQTSEEDTGLPVLRTWPALYVFVAAVFVGWVAVLYALTRMFS